MELLINYNTSHWSVRKLAREEYVKLQNGKCSHCGELLTGEPAKKVMNLKSNKKLFPENFFKWPVHLHHDHNTGMTIGAVHAKCNAILWEYHGE